jgi:hypothetical protein
MSGQSLILPAGSPAHSSRVPQTLGA